MTERAKQLQVTADGQIAELIELIAAVDDSVLRRPCPGREKLGDGTIGAALAHTADNYKRIAGFVETAAGMSADHQPATSGGHHIPKFLRAFGHGSQDHTPPNHSAAQHDDGYTAENINAELTVEQLNAARDKLREIAELTDSQLDQVPPKDSFRFCDGHRTLEQVLAGLLKHQAHQLEALSGNV